LVTKHFENNLVKEQLTKTVQRYTDDSLVDCIVNSIDDKKGLQIVSLDLRNIQDASADFFIICTAESSPQVRAIANFVETNVKEKLEESPWQQEGLDTLEWVILDYFNVVVHVFMPEKRTLYNLEELWSDANFTYHTGDEPH
jgi:ribosome-associated protein